MDLTIPELFQNAGCVIDKFWVYVPIISVAMVMQECHTFCKRRHSGLGHNSNLVSKTLVFNLFPFSS